MKWSTHNERELGKVVDELHAQIRDASQKNMVIWERILRLHVKPKPRWMPNRVWSALVNTVIHQSSQEGFLKGSQPMPEEVLDANAKNTQSS